MKCAAVTTKIQQLEVIQGKGFCKLNKRIEGMSFEFWRLLRCWIWMALYVYYVILNINLCVNAT